MHRIGLRQRDDALFHDVDGEAHHVDGVLKADRAGELARRHVEDAGWHLRTRVAPLEPGAERRETRLHDEPDIGALISRQIGEKRQLRFHPPERLSGEC
jgi:hypothetical protein